jgi:hypothetical protein
MMNSAMPNPNRQPAARLRKGVALMAAMLFCAQLPAVASEGIVDTVQEPPQAGERYQDSRFCIWIPAGVTTLRGIIFHQHGCGRNGFEMAWDVQWQALAKKHQCVLMGSTFYGDCQKKWIPPENGIPAALQRALVYFAEKHKHPELVQAPWALWGHSGGAKWAMLMSCASPERTIATFCRSTAFSPQCNYSGALADVPNVQNFGVGEKTQFEVEPGSMAVFNGLRAANAPACLAVVGGGHGCGASRRFAIPYLDACLTLRLPDKPGGALKKLDLARGWYGDNDTKTVAPAAKFTGDKATASWLPTEEVANKWAEFVKTGSVKDVTPPAAPFGLQAVKADSKITLTWNAEADLESGIKTFRVYRDGTKVGEYNIRVSAKNPSTWFQKENFGDEPDPGSRVMTYDDTTVPAATACTYQMTTVNWDNLESPKSDPITVKADGAVVVDKKGK